MMLDFIPGETYIRPSGKVISDSEHQFASQALEYALNHSDQGTYQKEFERSVKGAVKTRHAAFCNSGSSANLLAISALMSPNIEKPLKKGDRVITTAAGFPTTVAPIIQNGLIPIFCDVKLGTYNIDIEDLERTLQYNPKAIVLAHTMGNPYDIETITKFALRHGLYVVSDCCDALGAKYRGINVERLCNIATHSYYPAHIITTIEGGMVLTNSAKLDRVVRSFRDWGRDCWCEPGKDNTCGKRFAGEYDHKYVYSHLGYNLKSTAINAAIGIQQIKKLPTFLEIRRRNWHELWDNLKLYEEYFVLPEIEADSNPAWFGFVLSVKDGAPFTRNEITSYLENHYVGTRTLFGGNLTRQPAFKDPITVSVSDLNVTNKIMNDTFWIGCWPGITFQMINYIEEVFYSFMQTI